ncbi:V-type ATP synthase subunit E [Anaerococcus sp. Marseille-P3625]|uniref:V-type ATP synthase subunit E n=1 Tax=Anaerococcus sp. Marseille-P3625 TaxID=1977277 RepID=UPI000C074F56|nr:V-type ATP synthase subunit E [Anaerococcus sp. Marseille-P3625]
MNNLEVILESIINEGIKEKDQILDDANNKAREILENSENDAKAIAQKILDTAKKEAKTIGENEAVSTKRKARDIEIAAKNQVVDEIVEKLIENLRNIDQISYVTFVEKTLEKLNIGEGEILLSEKHKDTFKNDSIRGLKISDETCEDGFVVRNGKIEYDNRFSSIIKYNIDDIRKQISDEIFK